MDLVDSIHADIRARMAELAPAVAEFRQLEAAEKALELVVQDNPMPTAPAEEAPYGFTRNGKPRTRPYAPRQRRGAHIPAPTSAEAPKPARKRQEARINVLSSTAPTPKELEDREVAHTTQEPA